LFFFFFFKDPFLFSDFSANDFEAYSGFSDYFNFSEWDFPVSYLDLSWPPASLV